MKLLFFVILYCFVAFSNEIIAQGRLSVTVNNIKNDEGTIRVGLFTSEKEFLESASYGKIVKANHDGVVVIFENLPAGDYGISVIHDENENKTLDKNVFGLPKEGFCFGNNSMGVFGPPTFEKAKVSITENNTSIQILSLKYL